MKDEREELYELMPEGWREKCFELGAIKRKRGIQTPEQLLQLNMMYVGEGASYKMASVMMQLAEGVKINKTAVAKRIYQSGAWLRWLGEGVCQKQEALVAKPSFLGERRVLLADASDTALRGSKSSDYRLHYLFDLFGFCTRSVEVTDIRRGERLSNYALTAGDIVIADRIYGSKRGIAYAMENGADYILRMRHRAFALYDEAGEEMDILARLNALAERETVSFDAYIKDDKERLPVRIVGMRKTEDAIESARDRLRRRSVKKQQRVTEGAAIFNEYVVLATSLKDMTEEQILELYRARWQIEKVFHRLKSLLTIDEVAVRNREAVEAWFYGKLLLAALCEAMTRQAFSPAEEPDSDA